jgi:hypothetical protein
LEDVVSPFYQIYNKEEEEEDADDSFGCGINEVFPCSSLDWLISHQLPGVEVFPLNESFYRSSSIYVHSEGENRGKCGRKEIPCLSLFCGYSHLYSPSSSLSLILLSSSLHNETLVMSENILIYSEETEKMDVQISSSFSSSSSTIQNEGELTVERIIFHSLYSSIGNSPFILSSSGSSLSLSSSSFSFLSDSTPSFSLISVSSGSFSCSSVEIKPSSQTSFSSSNSLFSIETSRAVSFSLCSFDDLSLEEKSLVSSSSSDSLYSFSVDSCNATNIECSLLQQIPSIVMFIKGI